MAYSVTITRHGRSTSQILSKESTKDSSIDRVVQLRYVGPNRMSVVGPVTWARYAFDRPGAIVNVDAREAAALLRLPNLVRA